MNINDLMSRFPRPEKTYAEKESTMFYVYVFNLVMDEFIRRKLTNRRAINYVLSFTMHGNKSRAYQETHPMASKRTANVNANKYHKRFDVSVAQSITMYLVHKSRFELAWAVKYINVHGIERYVNKLILEVWKGE
ncbi:hypothetical protein [Leuconostoc mesenteroides]|uniref:hypothetical protein n=1 Tax=Leuconostoc mesenteroides TaxID=1245 RepID=UPI000A049F06|nr:hypothetical protein [Leuconostoc mesenteroides]ORI93283.1 hypothetical protein BMS99_07805 [Leuconostoc mesenteroides subsp. mesenteroides]